MKMGKYLTLLCISLIFKVSGQSVNDTEAVYTKTITQRADKITAALAIADSAMVLKVRDIIVQQYRSLNDIYTERDNKLKGVKEIRETNKTLYDEQMRNAMNEVNARLYFLHFDYLSKLMICLTPEQVDQVKDGMTYGVLPLTCKAYFDMVLNLTAEQKHQIKVWLTEARELAMDAGSSDEKHKWFGKYKGRINNYLSQAGYNMKQEGEEWQKRIKLNAK
jgi:Spy/CpxP family protein refolding chaperone